MSGRCSRWRAGRSFLSNVLGAAGARWRPSSRRSGRPRRPDVSSTSGTSPPPSSSPSWPNSSGSRRSSSLRSGGSSGPTWALEPMALPTYRAGGAQGAPLPERTTLTDLRSRPVTELPGVGSRIEASLGDLGIASLADMISHYPSRHEDLSNVKRISELRVGERATVFGTVVSTRPVGKPVRGRAPGFSVKLYDGTGYIPVTVWGRSWLQGQLLPEVRVVASGEVQSRYGIQIVARSIEVVDDPRGDEGPHAGRFVPVYPVNKGIQARRMRTLIHRALDASGRILDPLPADVLVRHGLPNLHDAVYEVHFPTERARLVAAMRRLIFHELFLIQAGLAARKARLDRTEVGAKHHGDGSLLNPFLGGLPFGLTGAQERVIEEVLADMRVERPMRRLLQGDVGSGKTVVAIAALLTAVEAGGPGNKNTPPRGPAVV